MDDRINMSRELIYNIAYARSVISRCKNSITKIAIEDAHYEILQKEIIKMCDDLDTMRRFIERDSKLWKLIKEVNDQR